MDLKLRGMVAVVSGASQGIGRATALSLASEGVQVVGVARRSPEEGVENIDNLALDLANEHAPAEMIEYAVRRYRRLDILVNNVGHARLADGFLDEPLEEWHRVINLNLMSAVRAMKAALPYLTERGGVIINVSSINARLPTHRAAAYSAGKAALNNLGKNAATEYASKRVRVITVSPGLTGTALWLGPDGAAAQLSAKTGQSIDEVANATAAGTPLGRFITPKEVGDCICFLASPIAAAVSGTEVVVDGGLMPTV